MNYLICVLIGYILGSIPTGYLILKKDKGIDIRKAGSGNVGALNSYEVSNSKAIGLLVLLIDALKGLLSAYISILLFPYDFVMPAFALTFAVFSHSFNPWLGFKGGRGLATAAGGTLLIFPILPFIWLVLWAIAYLIKKDILLSNIIATIFSLIIIFLVEKIDMTYSFPHSYSISNILFFASALLSIIFIRHIEPLKEIILKYKSRKVKNV